MNPYKKPADILLVEDHNGDIELMREALRDESTGARLHVVSTGQDALDYLFRRDPYANAPRPDLILLDFSLPGISGREVLSQIKTNPGLGHIPVVVLSAADSDEDVAEASSLHANCFITKPTNLQDSMQTLHSVIRFWLRVAQLPPHGV